MAICFDNLWNWSDNESNHSDESVDCYIACRMCCPNEFPTFMEFTNVELQIKTCLLDRLIELVKHFYDHVYLIYMLKIVWNS